MQQWHEIPGYAEALAQERAHREMAFVDCPRPVCGMDVRQPTMLDLVLLTQAGSPFTCGGPIEPGHIAQAMWILATEQDRRKGRLLFLLRVRKLKYVQAVEELGEFLDLELQDSPAGTNSKSQSAEIAAWCASVVHLIACNYGWSEADVMRVPVSRLFQYVRLIQRTNNPEVPLLNRSDRVRGEWLRKQSAATETK